MEHIYFKNNEVFSIEDLKNRIEELSIKSISLTSETKIGLYLMIVNNYDNPIVLKKSNLYVNPKWYFENKDVCDELFRYICSKVNENKINLNSKEFINDELISSLCLNKNLKILL